MSLEHLFSRSPVLPVDAAISLPRYLRTIRQTSSQAQTLAQTDPSRAALLHIRVLQLICKTLPQHPDYALPESKPVLASLRAIAHETFAHLETHAAVEDAPPVSVRMAAGVLDLFRRVVDDETNVGLLAGRVGETNEVTALVIPSQKGGDVRYDADVLQLAEVKGVTMMGALFFKKEHVTEQAKQAAKRFSGGDGFGVMVWEDGYRAFSVAEDKMGDASHVEVLDGTPLFKMYDLRPLAVARDEQRRGDPRSG